MITMPADGSLFYRDAYNVLYWIQWSTAVVDGAIIYDFTTTTKQPSVWGQPDQGYVKDRQVFRRGICSTLRQIIQPTADGYLILAEGESQTVCYFQTTFNCIEQPSDVFQYHLDHNISDFCTPVITEGSRFAGTPTDNIVFADVAPDGSIIPPIGTDIDMFDFVNVWANL